MSNNESPIMRFVKSSGIFFIGSVLSKAISIFLLPLYTSRIPTGDMGYYDISLTYITIATSFLFFDIWVAILRYMYDGKTIEQKSTAIKSGGVVFVISSVMFLILGSLFALIFQPDAIFWIILYGLFQNISNLLCFCVRGFQKNKEFAVSGIISTCFNVATNIVLILLFNFGFEALYISGIIGFLAQSIYLLVFGRIFRSLHFGQFNKSLSNEIFRYSLPLCLNSIAYWVLTSLNRIVLNGIFGNEASGIYAIGNKFSFVIGLVTTCFTYAWQDLSFSKSDEHGVGVFYSQATALYSKVLLMCTALALPVLKVVFPILVADTYSSAESTIPLFLIVSVVSAISTFIGNIFYAIKKTKMIFISMVTSALFNLLLCYPLIKYFYIDGANIAILLSFILNIAIRSFVLKKEISFIINKDTVICILPLTLSTAAFVFLNRWLNVLSFVVVLAFSIFYFKDYIIGFFSNNKKTNNSL